MKKLKIVSVASEVDPFSKTGGLADVARSLPKSLQRLDQEVIIITPFYKNVIDIKRFKPQKIYSDIKLHVDKEHDVTVSYYKTELVKGLPVYLVSADKYFGRKNELYGSRIENTRFYVFDVAVLKLISLLKFQADIIHCHDWQTGLIPELLKKKFKDSKTLSNAATVFTAHNLAFQLGHNWWEIPGKLRDNGRSALPKFSDEASIERINFAKRGFLYADAISTVSEAYAEEILKKNFGQDLHLILQNRRHKLFGVVNGIDYNEFNPLRDKSLKVNYDHNKIHRKKINKEALQKKYKLPNNPDIPIIVMTSRVAEQKGIDILLPILPILLTKELQFIIVGDANNYYAKKLRSLMKKFPDKMFWGPFDYKNDFETMLYAGGDIVLLPSRFEPCGIVQLKGLRYGCVPVVREIGGLGETVSNYDPINDANGIGFVFRAYNSFSLNFALARALETYKYKDVWKNMVIRGMRASFSWDLPAKKYLILFRLAIKFKKEDDNVK